MKYIMALFVAASLCLLTFNGQSQSPGKAAQFEYAVVKWDGPDRLYYNMPGKFELVYLSKKNVVVPKEAQPEEWCLAYAANELAREGWEAVNLNSRRIMFRRALLK